MLSKLPHICPTCFDWCFLGNHECYQLPEVKRMRFKIERYTLEEGEIEADTFEDATILLKYMAFPKIAWMTRGKPTIKLKMDDERDLHEIYSKSKRSN